MDPDDTLGARPEPEAAGGLLGSAAFRPVRAGNAFEETVERVLQVIKLGLVAHGERLPSERDLAGRLNVSRDTLREALHSLQRAGYVESRRGRYGGTFVTYRQPAPQPGALRKAVQGLGSGDLEDALTYRLVLETGAAEAAARRTLSDSQRSGLRRHLADLESVPADRYRQSDTRFHLAVAELTGSPSLVASLAEARLRLNDLLDAIPILERNIDHSAVQHRAMAEAILAGDAEAARRATEEHLEATAALLRGFLG
ncbi:FadR/GntR family transcriptional regulator [Actinacidiphila rubida]|uniref:FadR/GntR family transcriptional regulator n=1 Tax=Actinacidiphila rubida TaxID=310780 RepID=UPI00099F4867|nr:FCD domain-containing protein [Actinacidiphila rubida]